VNDIPVAVADTFEINNDQTLSVTLPGILGNDSDVDSPVLTANLVSGPNHGTLTLQPDGSFVYAPDATHEGLDSFTYRASDGSDDSQPVTVSILVHAVVGPSDNSLPENDEPPPEADDPPSESDDPASDSESPADEVVPNGAGPLESDDGESSAFSQSRESAVRSAQDSTASDNDEAGNIADSEGAPDSQNFLNTAMSRSGISGFDPGAGISIQGFSTLSASSPIHIGQFDATILWDKCVATQHEMASVDLTNALAAGTAVVLSGALTVGYIVWMLRSGFFVASYMSSVPAWMTFDPLPILESGSMLGATAAKGDEKDQSLVELVGGGELVGQRQATNQP
jgi:VCBS repeat-containing protein